MKRSQIILFSLFFIVTGIIYLKLSSNKKEVSTENKSEDKVIYVPIQEAKNQLNTFSLVSYGQVTPYTELMVSFEVQGKLIKGKNGIILKPGVKFRKGQFLCSIDNQEVYYTLAARKYALKQLLINILPDVEMDFSSELNKWRSFTNKIAGSSELPPFPEVKSEREQMFLTSRNIIAEYFNLLSQEARLKKYDYIAPFNGTVVEVYAQPGSIVNPGVQIAKIAKTGDYEVKVPISMEDLELYKSNSVADFIDPDGNKIATGKIKRISDVVNQQTQSADVYYSINPMGETKIFNGMFVNVSINKKAEKKTLTLPRSAIKDGKVNLLKAGAISTQPITIVSSKPDSVFVTGVPDGSDVILEFIERENKKVVYKGIQR